MAGEMRQIADVSTWSKSEKEREEINRTPILRTDKTHNALKVTASKARHPPTRKVLVIIFKAERLAPAPSF
jgi:hypothetical protein